MENNSTIMTHIAYHKIMEQIPYNEVAENAFIKHISEDKDISQLLLSAALSLQTAARLGIQRRLDKTAVTPP